MKLNPKLNLKFAPEWTQTKVNINEYETQEAVNNFLEKANDILGY